MPSSALKHKTQTIIDTIRTRSLGSVVFLFSFFFFFNDTATTEIYTLSLHDALPIYSSHGSISYAVTGVDRKSTRLNSSHGSISYAVFCLKQQYFGRNAHRPGFVHPSCSHTHPPLPPL